VACNTRDHNLKPACHVAHMLSQPPPRESPSGTQVSGEEFVQQWRDRSEIGNTTPDHLPDDPHPSRPTLQCRKWQVYSRRSPAPEDFAFQKPFVPASQYCGKVKNRLCRMKTRFVRPKNVVAGQPLILGGGWINLDKCGLERASTECNC
jgi:hypothetical protein